MMNCAYILCLFLQLALSGAHENIVSQDQPLAEGKLCLFTCSEWIFQEKVRQFAPSAELLGAGQLSELTIGLPCEDSSSHSGEGSHLHYQGVWGAVYVIDELEYNELLRHSQSEHQIAFASNEHVIVPNYADLNCITVDLGIQSGNYPPRQNPSHKLPNEDLDEAYYNQLGNLGVPQDYINGLRNISQKPSNHHHSHIPQDYHPMDNGQTILPGYDQIPIQNQQNGVLPNGNYNGQLPTGRSGSFHAPQQNVPVPATRSQYPQGNQLHPPGNYDSSADMVDQPFVEITPIRLSGDDYDRLHPGPSSSRPVSYNGSPTNVQEQYPHQITPELSTGSEHYPQPGGSSSVQQPNNYSPSEYLQPPIPHHTLNPSHGRGLAPNTQGHTPNSDQQQVPQYNQDFVAITPIRLPVTSNNGRQVVPHSSQQPSFGNNGQVTHPRGSSETTTLNGHVNHSTNTHNRSIMRPKTETVSGQQGSSEEPLPSDQTFQTPQPHTHLPPNGARTDSLGLSQPVDNSYPSSQRSGGTFVQPDAIVITPIHPGEHSQPIPGREFNPSSHPHLFSSNPNGVIRSMDKSSPESPESPEEPVKVLINPEQTLPLPGSDNQYEQNPIDSQPIGPNTDCIGDDSTTVGQGSTVLTNLDTNQLVQYPTVPLQRRPINQYPTSHTAPSRYGIRPRGYPSGRLPNAAHANYLNYPLAARPANYNQNYHTSPQNSPSFISNGAQPNVGSQFPLEHSAPITPQYTPKGVVSPQLSPELHPNDDNQVTRPTQSGVQQAQPKQMFYPNGYSVDSVPLPPDGNDQLCTDTPMFTPENYPSNRGQMPSDGNTFSTDTPMFLPDDYPTNRRQIPSNGNTQSAADTPMFIPENYPSNTRQSPSNGNTLPSTDTNAVTPDVQHIPSDYNSIQNPPLLYDHPMFIPDDTRSPQYPAVDSPYLPDEQMFFPDTYPQDSQGVLPVTDIRKPHATGLLPESVQDHSQGPTPLETEQVPRSTGATPVTSTDQHHATGFLPESVQDHSQGPTPLETEQVPRSTGATPVTSTNQHHATGFLPESVQDHSQGPTPLETEQVPRSTGATPVTSTNQHHATGFLPESVQDHSQGPTPLETEQIPRSTDAIPVTSTNQHHATGFLPESVQDHSQGPTPLETEQVPRSFDATPVTSTTQPHSRGLVPESTPVQDHSQGPTPLEIEQSTPLVTDVSPVMSTDHPHNIEFQPQVTNGDDTVQPHGIQSVQQGDLSQQQQSNQFGLDAGYTRGSNYNPSTFIAPSYSPDLPSLGFSFGHYFPQFIQQYSPHFMPSVDCYGPDELIPGFTFGNNVQLY